MCLATVYLSSDEETPVLNEVAFMEIDKDRLNLHTLFGEHKTFTGTLKEIDFEGSKILIDGAEQK